MWILRASCSSTTSCPKDTENLLHPSQTSGQAQARIAATRLQDSPEEEAPNINGPLVRPTLGHFRTAFMNFCQDKCISERKLRRSDMTLCASIRHDCAPDMTARSHGLPTVYSRKDTVTWTPQIRQGTDLKPASETGLKLVRTRYAIACSRPNSPKSLAVGNWEVHSLASAMRCAVAQRIVLLGLRKP